MNDIFSFIPPRDGYSLNVFSVCLYNNSFFSLLTIPSSYMSHDTLMYFHVNLVYFPGTVEASLHSKLFGSTFPTLRYIFVLVFSNTLVQVPKPIGESLYLSVSSQNLSLQSKSLILESISLTRVISPTYLVLL